MSPINLPPHTPVSAAILRAIADRHVVSGVGGSGEGDSVPLTQTGMINAVYPFGPHLVLRVPRNHPGHVAQLRREKIAVPAARAAGIRTPSLVAYDDTLDLLPVPYALYERVSGTPLELLGRDVRDAPDVWRHLGRDLGRLHAGVSRTDPAAQLADGAPMADPRPLVERRASEGWFTTAEAAWLLRWLERLAPAALEPVSQRLVHADTQPTNVMVLAAAGDPPVYEALIDWGCAHWGDDATDVACAPLRAAPFLLEGHRQIAPLTKDESAEARVLWRNWQILLGTLPRGAVPGFSWGENPVARLIDTLRFFAEEPGGRWAEWAPEPPRTAQPAWDPDKPATTWPHHFLSLPPIRSWISDAVRSTHGSAGDVQLAQVYEAKTRAVTARCTTQTSGRPAEDVVLKATLEPLFFYAHHVDRLVMRAAPQHVPELLAAEVVDVPTFGEGLPTTAIAPDAAARRRGRLYSLYRPFSGPLLRQLLNRTRDGGPAALKTATAAVADVSRAFARIQVAVASLPNEAKAGIPRVPVSRMPALYDDLLARIERDYLPRWLTGAGDYPPELGDPRAAFDRLRSMRDAVGRWTVELAAGPWPETIDHVDLQPSNAVVPPDGPVVIFDWEESVLSCPFFSVTMNWFIRTEPCSEAARDAYLDAIPWGTRPQRERALVLADRLGNIKDYQMLEVIRDSEGFHGVHPRGAVAFLRTVHATWPADE